MPLLTLQVITHPAGDHRLILSEFEGGEWNTGEKGITLTGVFATESEVHAQFGELERRIARAKKVALAKVRSS